MTRECRNCDYLTGRLQSAREDRDALAERADALEYEIRLALRDMQRGPMIVAPSSGTIDRLHSILAAPSAPKEG